MIRSIRFRLTLWFAFLLTVSLCLFGWVLYNQVKNSLARDVDHVLSSHTEGVEAALFDFWKAKYSAFPFEYQVRRGNFKTLVTDWANKTRELETMRPIEILTAKGDSVAASKKFEDNSIPIRSYVLAEAEKGLTVYETIQFFGYRVRIITRPVIEKDSLLYIIRGVSSLQQADASLARLRLWLFWLIPSTVFFSVGGGWLLATSAFRPVLKMIKQARQITAGSLHKRIEVPLDADELERLAATFNDMLSRLEQAFRRMRQFSAAASHELRTPLTIMKGEIELALRRPRDLEEYQRVLKTQLEALNEMASIVEQLLALARTEDGAEAVEWNLMDLSQVVPKVMESLRPIAESRSIQVGITSPVSVCIKGEARLIERLVSNLLDNALKHTPSEGRVHLKVESRERKAFLTVEDTGPGISEEELPLIFNKFFSSRISFDKKSTGLGLGLCRWIAEAHKGKIEVKNTPEGGASFTVSFPLIVPAE